MKRLTDGALIGTAALVCALAIGIVGWPSAEPASPKPALDAGSRKHEVGAARRSLADAATEVERMGSSAPAPAASEADESTKPVEARAALRGRVEFADGSAAGGAKVWSPSGRTLARPDGTFELAVASGGEPCRAALPGFQPALESQPGADGIVLRLGPPAVALAGRIRAENGLEKAGWRITALDATLIEPVELEAATHESASSRSPSRVQSSTDGEFALDGLARRPYTLAAWRAARERIELFAASPATPGGDEVEIQIPPPAARRTVELRWLDSRGAPLPSLRVGLPGTPPIAASDEHGKIVITGVLPAQVTLVLSRADGSVQARVVSLSASADFVLDGP